MAQLAIKGHSTRGKEVIEILEMLGGKISDRELYGNVPHYGYFISDNGYISLTHCSLLKNAIVFTLEEFLEKFPYKVGDKVVYEDKRREITKMGWEERTNTVAYKLDDKLYCNVIDEFQPYKERKYADLRIDIDQDDKLATEVTIDGGKITPPENYLIGKITKVDNGMLVEFVKKQPQYPKSYEECCKIIHSDPKFYIDTHFYSDALEALYKLLICRDAYWKIASEQMGLGKPWGPDWTDNYQKKWTINFYQGEINLTSGTNVSFILAFPTKEIRDVFFENFKELIKECISLL